MAETHHAHHASASTQPEDIDPLGRMHQVHSPEKRLTKILSIALVAVIVFIPIISAISDSPILNVFLGLSPLIATLIIDIVATHHHFKSVTFWISLVVVHMLALAILYPINALLLVPLNIPNAVSTSLLIGIVITAFCWLSDPKELKVVQTKHVVQFKPEKLEEYVQSIEDKCKAMNFVIGRVYRNSNGATPKMRERLKVPSEWYNEFTGKAEAEQAEVAKTLITKIRDRLKVYSMKEKEVFSPQEISHLKHLARDKDGEETILEVLKTNDRDPVEHYYVSAVEFCDRILEELR